MCEQFIELMPLYLENELSKTSKILFENHIRECESCAFELQQLQKMVDNLRNLPSLELPENYHSELMEKIESIEKTEKLEEIQKTKDIKRFKEPPLVPWRTYVNAAASLFLALVIVSAAYSIIFDAVQYNSSSTKGNYTENYGNSETNSQVAQKNTGNVGNVEIEEEDYEEFAKKQRGAPEAQTYSANTQDNYAIVQVENEALKSEALKIDDGTYYNLEPAAGLAYSSQDSKNSGNSLEYSIKSYYIVLEVENINSAIEQINNMPGYNLNSYTSSQTATIERTISQSESFEYCKETLRSIGKIVDEEEREQKITEEIIRLEETIKAKETEKWRVFPLLEQSTSVDNINILTSRLDSIDTEIDDMRSLLLTEKKKTEGLVASIKLIAKSPEEIHASNNGLPLITKVKARFLTSLNICLAFFEAVLIFLSGIFIPALIAGILSIVFMFVLRRGGKKWKMAF